MAIVKITELPAATSPVSPSDVAAVVQGGVTKKASISQLGYLPPGLNAVTRTIQNRLEDSISVKDFGAVGDGVTNDAAAIQAAITYAASSKKAVYAPAGTYFCGTSTLSFEAPIKFYGDGSQATNFSFSSGSTPAFAVGQSSTVNGLILSGFKISGSLSGRTALKLGINISYSVTDCTFADIRIESAGIGLQTTYSWSNVFSNVRCQGCVKPASFESQTNSTVFNGCDFVSYTTAMSMSNCEGLVFNAVNISNCATATYAFTMFQSNVVINSPYFENTPTAIAIVGGSGETYNSQLVINGGICGSGEIVAGKNGTYISVAGVRSPPAGGQLSVNTPAASPNIAAFVSVSPLELDKYTLVNTIFNLDYRSPALLTTAFGGGALTLEVDREYFTYDQSVSGNGVRLTTNLVIGKQYVLEYSLRQVSGITEGPNIRMDSSTSLGFAVPTDSEPWDTRRIYFVSTGTTLRLLFQGSIQWKAVRIYENIPQEYLPIPSLTQREWWFTSEPSTGTWVRGDIFWNTAPSAGGAPGWVCTAAGSPGTWKAMANVAA